MKDKGVPIVQYIAIMLRYALALWHFGWMFSEAAKLRLNWSGFIQHIFSKNDSQITKSEVLCLPIIDLNLSDKTCIYSTLVYIQSQAK